MNLEKLYFGVKVLEKGITGAIEDLQQQTMNPCKESIKSFKKEYGKKYEIHIKREQASNLLQIAAWALELKTFEEKQEEILKNVNKLTKEAAELLEAINE